MFVAPSLMFKKNPNWRITNKFVFNEKVSLEIINRDPHKESEDNLDTTHAIVANNR